VLGSRCRCVVVKGNPLWRHVPHSVVTCSPRPKPAGSSATSRTRPGIGKFTT
jgi:hypothetical protein